MSDIVIDASVVLALLLGEPLGNFEEARITGATISAINFSEVLTKLISGGLSAEEANDAVAQLDLRVVPFAEEDARIAAQLWQLTRRIGLSLGDRACIALGLSLKMPIVTADRAWGRLDFGGRVIVVR